MKAILIFSILVATASAGFCLSTVDEKDMPLIKGKTTVILQGYPTSYGNEPFTFIGIQEAGDLPKSYYVYPGMQKEARKIPYAYYQFQGYLIPREEWMTNSTNRLPPEATAFEAVFIPIKWKKLK